MADFVMPALGADMQAGTLLTWLKQPGDEVARGEIIAVVHTDKADVEVEVFTSGVIERLLVEPGAEVPVGTALAVIREDGAPPAPAPAHEAPPAAAPPAAAAPHVLISPSARQLALELGVDPATIEGTGPSGRIQRKDVERAAAAAREAAPPPPAPPPPPLRPPRPQRLRRQPPPRIAARRCGAPSQRR